MERAAPLPLLDLAFGGGYLAARVATDAGGLLHRLFTLTRLVDWWLENQFPVPPIYQPGGLLFCGPFPRVAHPADAVHQPNARPPGRYPAPCPVKPGLSSRLPPHPPIGGKEGGQERDRLASLDAILMIAYYW